MSRPSNTTLSLAGLLRVLFRWKTAGLTAFAALALLAVAAALFRSPRYESQILLERKPARVTPGVAKEDERYDVYRLTSESQWSVALLKSRFMMERWMEAVGLPAGTPAEKERQLQSLARSITVQPISYTDLFSVRVRALSPQEAHRRAGLLAEAFASWDLEENRKRAGELLTMLQERLKQLSKELSDQWARLKRQKGRQSLSLSGSSAARELELDISAKGKLYDMLTAELEGAERQLNTDRLPRTRPLSPPSMPGTPVTSRLELLLLGLCASLMGALAFILLCEWQDPSIRRSQDILREIRRGAVLAVPQLLGEQMLREGPVYLGPLSDAVSKLVQDHGSAVVQFASAGEGDGKTTFSSSLARALAPDYKVCLLHRVRSASGTTVSSLPSMGDYKSLEVSMSEPLSGHLAELKRTYNLIVIDTDSVVDSPPGSNLAPEAELACILVSAGRTTRQFFHAFGNQLQRLPHQQLVFILNRYEDPLPSWFQHFDTSPLPSALRRFF